MNACTSPTFWRLPFESAPIGRSSSSSSRSASAGARAEVGEPAQLREVGEELARGQPLVEPQVAGQVADPAAHARGRAARVDAEQLDPPARRPDQVEQQPDRRRLAGAVRPEEAEHLAGLDLEVEVDDAALAAVQLGQSFGADDGVAGGHSSTLQHGEAADVDPLELRGELRDARSASLRMPCEPAAPTMESERHRTKETRP